MLCHLDLIVRHAFIGPANPFAPPPSKPYPKTIYFSHLVAPLLLSIRPAAARRRRSAEKWCVQLGEPSRTNHQYHNQLAGSAQEESHKIIVSPPWLLSPWKISLVSMSAKVTLVSQRDLDHFVFVALSRELFLF